VRRGKNDKDEVAQPQFRQPLFIYDWVKDEGDVNALVGESHLDINSFGQ
jgi:hypothetical protein